MRTYSGTCDLITSEFSYFDSLTVSCGKSDGCVRVRNLVEVRHNMNVKSSQVSLLANSAKYDIN